MLLYWALAPLALLLALLLFLRWSAAAAGSVSAIAAFAIAALRFDYGANDMLAGFLGPVAEAAFIAATILWIIFGALWLHEYQVATGAIARLGSWVQSMTNDRRLMALLVAWFFALFLEGAAGFGTPVALAAPLMVALGFPPVQALALVLIGHSIGVSFGALGTPIAALLSVTGANLPSLSVAVALLHALLAWILALFLFRAASEGQPDGQDRAWLWPLVAVASFVAPFVLIAWAVGPELPTLLGAVIGFLIFLTVNRRAGLLAAGSHQRTLLVSAVPYASVVALILLTRLIGPARYALQSPTLEWNLFDRFSGSVAPLYHPGTLIAAGLLMTAILAGQTEAGKVAAKRAALRLPKVALALFSVLLLARVSLHSGMIATIAEAAATNLGGHWILLSPAIGALGSFVTGSATASNILFSELQLSAAADTETSPLLAAAGQGFGSAAGNMIAPHNIVTGAATVGALGAESQVIRRTLLPCITYVIAGGVILWLGACSLSFI